MPFLAGVLVLGSAAGVRGEEVTKTFTVSGHARVKVETDDGAVRVSTGDIKQVEVRVIYSGYKLDKDLMVSATQSGDTVEVEAKTVGWRILALGSARTSSLRVEVHMPKDADLTVTTGDGSVEAESINGNLDVHTGDGSIAVQGAKGDDTAAHRGWIDYGAGPGWARGCDDRRREREPGGAVRRAEYQDRRRKRDSAGARRIEGARRLEHSYRRRER